MRAHLRTRDTLAVLAVMHLTHLLLALPLMQGWGPLPALGLPGPPGSDKVGHFLAYFTLTAWAVWTFRARRTHLLAALALVGLGVAMEFAQARLTQVRLGDVRDALANTLGVAAGLSLTFTPMARALEWLDARLFGRKAGVGGN